MQEKALSLLIEYQSTVVKEYLSLLPQALPCTVNDLLSLPYPKSLHFIIKKQFFLIIKKRIESGIDQEVDCHFISESFSIKEWNSLESIFQKISLEERFLKMHIQTAVQDYVQFLLAPKNYWVHHLFGSEPFVNPEKTVRVEKVKSLLVSMNEYPYLSNVFFQYIERKQLSEITAQRFNKIIGDIDRKVISTFNSDDFRTLLTPFFITPSQVEKRIPIELFRLFFYQKELNRETELFQSVLNQGIFELYLTEAIDLLSGNHPWPLSQAKAVETLPFNETRRSDINKEESADIQLTPIQSERRFEKPLQEDSIQDYSSLGQDDFNEGKVNSNEIEGNQENPSQSKTAFENERDIKEEKGILIETQELETIPSITNKDENFTPSEAVEQSIQSDDLHILTVDLEKTEAKEIISEELQFSIGNKSEEVDVNRVENREQNMGKEKGYEVSKQDGESKQDDYPPFDISPEAPSQAKSFEELLKAIREKSEQIHQKKEQENNEGEASPKTKESNLSDTPFEEQRNEDSFYFQPPDVKIQERNHDELENLKSPTIEPLPNAVLEAEGKSPNLDALSPETWQRNERFEDLKTDSTSGGKGDSNESIFFEKPAPRPSEKFDFAPIKPLIAPEKKVSIETLFSLDEKKRIIKKVFKGNRDDFDQAISRLDSFNAWREASIFIDQEIFNRFKVDEYSEEAVLFTDSVFNHFYSK